MVVIFITVLHEIHERKVTKIIKSTDKNIPDELATVIKCFPCNRRRYPSEVAKFTNDFKIAMEQLKEDVIPIYGRSDYIQQLTDKIYTITEHQRTIYLALLNFKSQIWSPSIWEKESFKNLLKAKKLSHEKGLQICTILVFDKQNKEIEHIIKEHKSVGRVFICTEAAPALINNQCAVFLQMKKQPDQKDFLEDNFNNYLSHLSIDYKKSVLFLEQNIYTNETFDGQKILNPEKIKNYFDSYKANMNICEPK